MGDSFHCDHCKMTVAKSNRRAHEMPCTMPAPTEDNPSERCHSYSHPACTHIKETAS